MNDNTFKIIRELELRLPSFIFCKGIRDREINCFKNDFRVKFYWDDSNIGINSQFLEFMSYLFNFDDYTNEVIISDLYKLVINSYNNYLSKKHKE